MTSISPARSVTASLDDPLYYLVNFRFVLAWVAERHGGLLNASERAFLATFEDLPRASRALLVRMVMRKGEHFRLARLGYAEIGDTAAALSPLIDAGWVEPDPELTLDELFRQLRLPELRRALADEIAAAGLPASVGKAALYEALAPRLGDCRRLAAWWPEAPDRIVRLAVMETCDRLRLMFFGNLRQDWAEFVLAELGVQRFERVAFSPESRAFQCREEVDAYLALHRLRERLEAGDSPEALHAELPAINGDNGWLAGRRTRLLLQLGVAAERAGERERALALYAEAGPGEPRIRRLRLLERMGEHARAHELAERAAREALGEQEHQALERLRLRLRLGLPPVARVPEPVTERWDLALPGPVASVELAVRDHLSSASSPVHYVENALLTGLFGLLCWGAVFAPLPGAFFHPFHGGPADLHREDFVARRRALFDTCLGRLDDGSYREAIRHTWGEKQGTVSPFVHWGVLTEALLEQALAAIPTPDLRACFARLLADLKANRAGLPDLIQFLPEADAAGRRYRLIEVKGPGDRLQDNQRRWLAFFHACGIPAVVCHVRWQDTP
ncbi:VRR-NUC domain-containing protein [Halomonas heilongjiangensis]|uniref:phosphodiesterase I n=1 Tax=Halomonas heilongjiangensis TaxID=1387883 RepID=A0A2N7TGR4_9GAMM|nr:VRR-NUC domain-containing protein [Halomonas heilongjiangensis]PMR67374.1 nuclease [Halomonas heilongjiangensis]PXX91132.1 nuclease [Halomonas heilongjiangensis]